ncbi:MAG TPA: MDR family MFS transporter [Steroidobacteraceae bacterium]|nr:MDR family MFS transporter [Steroidobacteraceae bacterium]
MPSLKSNRALVIGAVMSTMAMTAIEATIVTTAMPQIIGDLGGLRWYSWVFSSFLLAQTSMTVVFGNLADVYGRKPMMLVGIGVFLLGSLLAGFAWSMPAMIGCRLIQGAGAGAMQPVAMTIVADLYPARERGKVQGYLASVWALAAVVGPLIGGLIIRSASWAWIFWINIPVGILAAAGYILFLKDSGLHVRRSIDVAGAVSFTLAVTSLLIALTEVGNGHPARLAGAAVVAVLAAMAFVLFERRAVNPIVSFTLWSHRPIAATNGVAVLASMTVVGLTTFLPIYVQIVMQRSPTVAGLALTTLLIGWPVGATLAARLFHGFSLRSLLVSGALLQPVGAVLFVVLAPAMSPLVAAAGSLVMGFGMGLMSVSSLVLIQEIVEPAQRGSVTASNLFARNFGSTLGATLLGAVLNHGLRRAGMLQPITSDDLRRLLLAPSLAPDASHLRLAMEQALNLTFWAMMMLSLATVLLALRVPASALMHAPAKVVPEPAE